MLQKIRGVYDNDDLNKLYDNICNYFEEYKGDVASVLEVISDAIAVSIEKTLRDYSSEAYQCKEENKKLLKQIIDSSLGVSDSSSDDCNS